MVPYDEFSMFSENAAEFDIAYHGPPTVERVWADLGDGRRLSGLKWGAGSPELVFLHGGAQNAHTWDTVALALDRPMLCLDLVGHGHSDAPAAGTRALSRNAEDVAVAVSSLAPGANAVVGMSLGGLTSLALIDHAPHLVSRTVLVDITPGVDEKKASAITAFVNGPESFPSFDELLARTMEFNPTRSESSLRRGILHNAEQRPDDSWVWRYARHRSAEPSTDTPMPDLGFLWDVIEAAEVPMMLVRGLRKGSVVDDADEAEFRRRRPAAQVEHVAEAGHSIQGDAPIELAGLIAGFVVS
ncbi:MAG: alpha/beta hydrolase [Acidimicrobiales bacterium]